MFRTDCVVVCQRFVSEIREFICGMGVCKHGMDGGFVAGRRGFDSRVVVHDFSKGLRNA